MALTFSVAARNARLAALIAELGASPVLKIRSGAAPSNVGGASTGTVVATCNLPASPFAAPAGGSVSKAGTWEDTAADATDTNATKHFELCKADGTTVVARGSVTATGGGGDMTVDNMNFAAGQAFSVTSFTLTDGNAGS